MHPNVRRSFALSVVTLFACTSLAAAQPDPWPDEVLSVSYGPGAGFGQDNSPDNVLGPPDSAATGTTPSADPAELLSLGAGGQIVLAFADGGIVDGPGPDVTIFENAFYVGSSTFAEPASVELSVDGSNWHLFPYDLASLDGCAGVTPTEGSVDPTDPAVSGGDSFDLADLGLSRAYYLRLTDLAGDSMGVSAGFDLDAVAVVHGEQGAAPASLPLPGLFTLLGFSGQQLAIIPADPAADPVMLGELAPTAARLRLIGSTLYVLNGDAFGTGAGGGLWRTELDELATAVDQGDPIPWQTLALDGDNPYDLVAADGELYVSLQTASEVLVLDEEEYSEIARIGAVANPQGLALAGGRLLVAASAFGAGDQVMVIDPVSRSISDSVTVGRNPQWIEVDGQDRFHVLCTGDYSSITGQAWRIGFDAAGAVSTDSLALGGFPGALLVEELATGTRVTVGDEYAMSSPHLYSYDGGTMTLLESSSTPAAGWTLAADGEGTRYVGSSVNNLVHQLDGDAAGQIASFTQEVAGLAWAAAELLEVAPVRRAAAATQPRNVVLAAAWPNPFNASATVAFSLLQPARVRLSLLNLLGQRVRSLQQGQLAAGEHRVSFEAGSLASGHYLLLLEAGAERQAQRITLLR